MHYVDEARIKSILEDHRYRLLERIDEGGYGTVYRVEQFDHGPLGQRAVKVHHEYFTGMEALSKQARRELDAARELRNADHIVANLGYFVADGLLFTVWELGECSLRDLLRRRLLNGQGSFSPQECYKLARTVAQGLDAVHQTGYEAAHGDVKLANLIVFRDGDHFKVKVGDLGLAYISWSNTEEHTKSDRRSHLYSLDSHAGKPTKNRDQFGFALAVSELLLGHHPYGQDRNEIESNLERNTPLKLENRLADPALPENLRAVLTRIRDVLQEHYPERTLVEWLDDVFTPADESARRGPALSTPASGDSPQSVLPTPGPRLFVVPSPEYPTIASAMRQATPQSTIRVRPGEYLEAIEFREGVRLIGEDRDRCVIQLVPGEQWTLRASSLTAGWVEQLTFEGWTGTPQLVNENGEEYRPDGLVIDDSVLSVRNCRFLKFPGCGIYVRGSKSRATLLGNTCEENQHGILLDDCPRATADGNICRKNSWNGITVQGEKTVGTLTANTCEENQHGILLNKGAQGTADRNICRKNLYNGIYLHQESVGTLAGNTCEENQCCGIEFSRGAHGTAKQNKCSKNLGTGIGVNGEKTVGTLTGNTCEENQQYGIAFWDGTQGTANQNVCRKNLWNGIAVQGEKTVGTVTDNTCEENQRHGIGFWDGAQGTTNQNKCRKNLWSGIALNGEKTVGTLTDNTCEENQRHGIGFWDGAQGTANQNKCRKNLWNGIIVSGEKTVGTLTGNTCDENQQHGIEFWDGAQGTANQNKCRKNLWNGIAVSGEKTVGKLTGNTCEENQQHGIGFWDGAPGTASRNICRKNASWGIFVSDKRSVTLTANEFEGNVKGDIRYE